MNVECTQNTGHLRIVWRKEYLGLRGHNITRSFKFDFHKYSKATEQCQRGLATYRGNEGIPLKSGLGEHQEDVLSTSIPIHSFL